MADRAQVRRWIRSALTRSPLRTAGRALQIANAARRGAADRRTDARLATYAGGVTTVAVRRLLEIPSKSALETVADDLASVTRMTLEHRFDLLGSGWLPRRYGMSCPGIENVRFPPSATTIADYNGLWLRDRINDANLSSAQQLWRFVDTDYEPIDWQLDVRSGFRWKESTWYRDISYGDTRGADVKGPWELGRLQHLPRLALAYALASREDPRFQAPDIYLREYRNEVMDFATTNPPRFGVNWAMTMDVAIRAANMLIGYDLFRAAGAAFEPAFEALVGRMAIEHGRHIASNLEWSDDLRGNHYLADLAGWLVLIAYTPQSDETDAWMAVAAPQFLTEIGLQFNKDGSNFEASTSYHRLSAEMATYATAALLRLWRDGRLVDEPTVRSLHALPTRLLAIANFTVGVTRPDGAVWQVGDNDNGRFLSPVPTGSSSSEGAWVEDHLDHRGLIAAIDGLIDGPGVRSDAVVTSLVRSLAGGPFDRIDRATALDPAAIEIGDEDAWSAAVADVGAVADQQRVSTSISLPDGAIDGAVRLAFPDFGAFIVRSDRLFVGIRCGTVGQRGVGGHAHNDQLSIELWVDGVAVLRDPGTYVYTPFPDLRNAYRSQQAHNGPILLGREPADLDQGLFALGPGTDPRCHYWGHRGFAGRVAYADGVVVTGLVEVGPDSIRITYSASGAQLAPIAWTPHRLGFSPGYGSREGVT